jgi:hypothetical protein
MCAVPPVPPIVHFLPSLVTTGEGLGLGVFFGNFGGGSPITKTAVLPAEHSAEKLSILPKGNPL